MGTFSLTVGAACALYGLSIVKRFFVRPVKRFPTYDADREGLAGRACEAFAIQPSNDLFIIVFFRHRADFSNEGVGITGCLGAVWLAADIDSFGRSALPANLQVQQLGFCTLDDRDIADQQTQHSLAVAS